MPIFSPDTKKTFLYKPSKLTKTWTTKLWTKTEHCFVWSVITSGCHRKFSKMIFCLFVLFYIKVITGNFLHSVILYPVSFYRKNVVFLKINTWRTEDPSVAIATESSYLLGLLLTDYIYQVDQSHRWRGEVQGKTKADRHTRKKNVYLFPFRSAGIIISIFLNYRLHFQMWLVCFLVVCIR